MSRTNPTQIALLVALISISPARVARADSVSPQFSVSVGFGSSHHALFGHLWAGAGANLVDDKSGGRFVLAGVEADFRGSDHPDATDGMDPPATQPGHHEVWLAARFGVGIYGPVHMAPKFATYAIVGWRVAGPAGEPRLRLGAGLSLPLALQLAALGIPTMLEFGIDVPGVDAPSRGFIRTGWNF
jgi:hypothetical protein